MRTLLTKIFLSLFLVLGIYLVSCEKLFEPVNDNHLQDDWLIKDPSMGEGLLLNGYAFLNTDYNFNEVATDDAVSNVKTSSYLRMATGEWSSLFNPMSIWDQAYEIIYYLNYFLNIVNDINFAWDDSYSSPELRKSMFIDRYTGEAKVLRAWFNFELLKRHGGIAKDGNPQGFIIMRSIPDRNKTNLPRNSYDECVNFILEDINEGISLLPDEYEDITDGPSQEYITAYNVVFGNLNNKNRGRVNGKFAKALKSRVTLHVASQSFNNKPAKWDSAAVAAALLLDPAKEGGIGLSGMSPRGVNFWYYEWDDNEIIFRNDYYDSNHREINSFPPSLFGNGDVNPSQNLVDAFPMANGYPINHPSSGYNPANPYSSRDPRLSDLIIYNGNDLDYNFIGTNVEEPKDGINKTIHSTRTGYYIKKLLSEYVNINPVVMSTAEYFYTLFRYTEIFLNYAEAANEAWGPDADPNGYGFTPRNIIYALRQRGGIEDPADTYLYSLNTKEEMRGMIRNERRIELCFEGFRFWDIRRWDLSLNEKVKGMSIENGVHKIIDVEDRPYKPFMKYGPIPYQETLKSNLTLQNEGW